MDVKINLNTVEKVKRFVSIITAVPCNCDIISESRRYIIDAKSIMGIFSLDLSKDLTLKIYCENITMVNNIKDRIADFIV